MKQTWCEANRATLCIARQQWRARIETAGVLPMLVAMVSIARQQWRARIETCSNSSNFGAGAASPASNGGRGLKQCVSRRFTSVCCCIARQQWRARIETIFMRRDLSRWRRIARQQWRARIETPPGLALPVGAGSIARQQWRARIETGGQCRFAAVTAASPASNGGRGLKQRVGAQSRAARRHRPPAMAGAD